MDEKQTILDILRRTPLFSHMSEDTGKIFLSLSPAVFSAGEVISCPCLGGCLGILLSGKAAIYGRDSGKRVLLNRIEKGAVFDAATVFFSEKSAVSNVIAGTKCRALFIERAVLEKIIMTDSAVAHDYIIFLSDKIGFLNKKIIAFTAKGADGALASYLLDQGQGEVRVNMTRLASTLDVGRTTLYRASEVLEREGVIRHEDGKMIILDREKLAEKAKD